ncbi:IPT/TIG domain-containing protein [Ruicaihuangia caeni]|uniref:IPT/TIG domain-containing protein n=1 Tax=Ruicaihuangia caeni TaxID=3042517 RepID=A0AAW6T178_9MICO|nr:IPT/TIG domain-containing protein [Klugiella sp. YN-L-19]MDI2097552.1 IPT/TIG domain-containing protein [Klugiella sp. YN-L-19]
MTWSAAAPMFHVGASATFLLMPRITSVAPAEARVGEEITILGTGFDHALTTSLRIGSTVLDRTRFSVVSDTELRAIVPAGTPPGYADVQVTSDTLDSALTAATRVLVVEAAPAAPGGPASGGSSVTGPTTQHSNAQPAIAPGRSADGMLPPTGADAAATVVFALLSIGIGAAVIRAATARATGRAASGAGRLRPEVLHRSGAGREPGLDRIG